MTNTEMLLSALNEVDDRYLLEVDKRISSVKTRRRATFSSIAAVFVLVIGSFAFMISNTAWGNAGYGIYGESAGGYFYYEIPYDGIYRYTVGGEAELIVKVKRAQFYEFIVNDIGLYYIPDDTSVYMIPHGSDESSLFFEDEELNFFNMYKYDSKDLLLRLDYSDDEIYHEKEVIIDGKTGEEKCVTYEHKSYYENDVIEELDEQGYSYEDALENTHAIINEYIADEIDYTLENRNLKATAISDKKRYDYGTYTLTENSKKLLADDEHLSDIPQRIYKDCIVFKIGEKYEDDDSALFDYYIARANGKDSKIKSTSATTAQGNADYLYYIGDDDNLMYINTYTSESKVLQHLDELSYKNLFSDGKYIYISDFYFTKRGKTIYTIECYEIEFDENGKPTGLKLIDENIIE